MMHTLGWLFRHAAELFTVVYVVSWVDRRARQWRRRRREEG